MTNQIHAHLLLSSAVLALAACSSAQSQEVDPQDAANIAVVTQSGPDLAMSLQAADPQPPPSEEPPPLVVPQPRESSSSAPPLPPARATYADADCEIAVERTPRGIRVTPVVHTHAGLTGEYTLVVKKSGASGSSNINQGGPFVTAHADTHELGVSEVSLESGDRFNAELIIRAHGREICRAVRS